MVSPLFFHRLRLLLDLEIDSVDVKLKRLQAGDYPTGVAPNLICAMLQDLEKQRTTVAQIVASYDADPIGAFQRLQSEHRKLLLQLPYITSVENAQTTRVPWSLVPSFEVMAAALMPGRELLTTCASDFNYAITWRVDRKPGVGIANFDVLELPAIHRVNAFLHVLVGHELMHPILGDFFATEQQHAYANLRTPCAQFLNSQQPHGTLFDANRLDEMVEAAARMWRRAVEELMCDLGCAAIFGPAALLAMSTFASSSNLDQVPKSPTLYPPHRFRLRTICRFCFTRPEGQQALAELISLLTSDPTQTVLVDSADQLQAHLSEIKDLTADVSDIQRLRSYPLLKIAYDEVDRVIESAWTYVNERVSKAAVVTWRDVLAETKPHLHSMRMSVPAGEIRHPTEIEGPPANIAAIALAAWLFELHCERQQLQKRDSKPLDEYLKRCRLLLKSVEDAEMKRRYLERRANRRGTP